MIEGRSFSALRPTRAYAGISVLCLAGIPVVWLMAQPGSPVVLTTVALLVQAAICLVLALTVGLRDTPVLHAARAGALFAVGLLAGVPAWFFGPQGAFSSLVVLMSALAGVLTGAMPTRHPVLAGWMAYVGLAIGQLIVIVLVLGRVIPDTSLATVLIAPYPAWQYGFWHLSLQGIFFGAFFAGRVFQRRYRTLAEQLEATVRTSATKEALLDQARAEYLRALVVGRAAASAEREAVARGLVPARPPRPARALRAEGETTEVEVMLSQIEAMAGIEGEPTRDLAPSRPHTPSLTPVAPARPPAAASRTPVVPLEEQELWLDAYRAKMRRQHAVVIGLSVFGILVFGLLHRERDAALFAGLCLGGIIAATLLHRRLAQQQAGAHVYWPWVLISGLAIGPAHAAGIHSALAGLIAALLFFGGLFRASHRVKASAQRVWALVAVCGTHLAMVIAIGSGLVPDHGLVPVLDAGGGWTEPIAGHLLTQGVFIAAFVAGSIVDRRYEALTHRAEAAQQDVARKDALLTATTAQIDRVFAEEGEGLFAGHRLGRFELVRMRARGGMGDVYEGIDVQTRTPVAVKLLRYDRASDARMIELFAREAKLLSRVRSPHVAGVFEIGGLDADLPYLAMELIEGSSLAAILRARGRLPVLEVRAMIRDLAAGLTAIHEAGIVHRDVKPPNIMLAEGAGQRVWKLVDLGAAQVREPTGAAGESVIGTPTYMAPEQALGDAVDGRADLYGLCCVIYGALTGRPAFTGREAFALGKVSLRRVPPPPQYFVPLSMDVEVALRIGLAVRPDDRFATAAELATSFEAAFAHDLHPALRMRGLQLLEREPWAAVIPAEAAG